MRHAADYFWAAKLLHAITLVELVAIFSTGLLMDSHPFKLLILMVLGLYLLFTQLDARSRYQEFKKVRDQLLHYGPDKRIFRSVSGSRCQRDAALAATIQQGYESECRIYFRLAGYRWYHLLPDIVKSQPYFLCSATFWRATFFASGYRTRI